MKSNKPLIITNHPSEYEFFVNESEYSYSSELNSIKRNKRKACSHWLEFEIARNGMGDDDWEWKNNKRKDDVI